MAQEPAAPFRPLLTTEQVAERLGMTKSWIYDNWKAEGIPFIRIGQQLRCDPMSLEEWITKHASAA